MLGLDERLVFDGRQVIAPGLVVEGGDGFAFGGLGTGLGLPLLAPNAEFLKSGSGARDF
jgi:hypothetical protein